MRQAFHIGPVSILEEGSKSFIVLIAQQLNKLSSGKSCRYGSGERGRPLSNHMDRLFLQ